MRAERPKVCGNKKEKSDSGAKFLLGQTAQSRLPATRCRTSFGQGGGRHTDPNPSKRAPWAVRLPGGFGERGLVPARSTLRVLCLISLLGLVACEGPSVENGFSGDPAVWPQAARLGDSAGWLLSSELLASLQAAPSPFFTWSRDNVEIGLIDEQGHEVILFPRAIFEVQSAMGAQIRGGSHEANIGALVAMFDLPDPWPNASNPNPSVLGLVLYVDSQVVPDWTNTIEVLGSGGAPTVFGVGSDTDPLQLAPMLRLRPRWGLGIAAGVDPDWVIAGIEFTLNYPDYADGDILNPRAVPAGDAATALTLTGPVTLDGTTRRVRFNVILPGGFKLFHEDCDPSGCYSGRTALIDIVFDKDSGSLPLGTPVFAPDDFEITDLKIIDPNGVRLNASIYGVGYFDRFVVNNLSEGP